MTDDERAIRVLVATWMAASQAGDVSIVLGLMADDAVFMVPGREGRLGLPAQLSHRQHDSARRRIDAPRGLHALDPAQRG
jgi:uncharacterized protein (TIGR02246 family)